MNVLVEKATLDSLAESIGIKSGEDIPMTLPEMIDAVDGIDTGGITPTGNIDITQAGETDVTNYATATVPEGEFAVDQFGQFITEDGVKKWQCKARGQINTGDSYGAPGYIEDGTYVSSTVTYNAIPSGTTITPSTSSQTIGGANYMMQGAVTVSAMPSGTAGTPTATKGTVSNHQVSVTPSVTNTTGYITGSTKTGTAVTVTASELASGNKAITENGTNIDVVGYSTVSVAVPSSGGSVTQDANGYIVLPSTGGGGGGGGATQHTIHLEFSDSSDEDIDVYYDDSLIGTMITAYEPSTWTYSNKTVTLAQLDSVTWYDKQSIPLNVQLIDYTAVSDDTAIDSNGAAVSQQWYCASDYTQCEPGMTFTFRGCRWFYIAFYDASKAVLLSVSIDSITTPDPNDSNVGIGTLGSGIPANTKYVRITATGDNSDRLSLIRTA